MPTRAIFDCMLFIQAISNDRGAAGACFHLVEDRRVQLLMSPEIWHEIEKLSLGLEMMGPTAAFLAAVSPPSFCLAGDHSRKMVSGFVDFP